MGILCDRFGTACDPKDYDFVVKLADLDASNSYVYLGKDGKGVIAKLENTEIESALRAGATSLSLPDLSARGIEQFADNAARGGFNQFTDSRGVANNILRENGGNPIDGIVTRGMRETGQVSRADLREVSQGLMDVGTQIGYELATTSRDQNYRTALQSHAAAIGRAQHRIGIAEDLGAYATDLRADVTSNGDLTQAQKTQITGVLDSVPPGVGPAVAPPPVPR